MLNTPTYIVIHTSDVSYKTLRNQFNSINNYHRGQFGVISELGYYVGYHRLITGGKNYKCRNDSEIGTHNNALLNGVSMNFQSLGVCIGFDGDIEYPPQPELDLCIDQIVEWMDLYNIPLENVQLHRDTQTKKTCPGSLLDREYFYKLIKVKVMPTTKPLSEEIKRKEILEKVSLLQTLLGLLQKLLALRTK